VFSERLIQPAVHINAVGSDFPGKTEIPRALLSRSLVCPDFPPQAIREGECQQLEPSLIGPDLLQLVKEETRYQAYRDSSTVFDSTGWALEDYVTMNLLMDYGRQLDCGTEISIADLGEDPHNPYAALGSCGREDRQAG
jgi:ornithine cyclodeaminase/alanine dehydrogenase-like protein (mu-crystallin family)